ncbi:MAG: DUF1002 domain-containing protein [Lachnospiraceae bacterium]|nr:DUF1002 domain-containing protein [Lachnospiraceae bacterium]
MRKKRRRTGLWIVLFLLGIACIAFVTARQEERSDTDKGEETIVGCLIDMIAAGEVELSDENSVRQAISESENKLGITLTEENKKRIVGFMQTLDSIEVEAEDFMEQAKEMYQKYSTELVEEANTAINKAVGSVVESAAKNFFESIKQSVQNFIKNLTTK